MPSLFHLRCSPRAVSASAAAAEHFLGALRARRADWSVDTLDLWQEALPEFDAAALAARAATRAGRALTEIERDAYANLERTIGRLGRADRVLISTPMWNYALPYKLKHWLDLIIQPGLAFRVDPARGFVPLLPDRPCVAIVASGGDYLTGSDGGLTDYATPYLRDILRFIGLRDARIVTIGPTAGRPDRVTAARDRAHRALAELARSF